MKSFRHIVPPLRLFSGADSLDRLEAELDRLKSRRAVIFCGSTLGQSPLIDLVKASAGSRIAGVYAEVRPNTPLPTVQEAVAELRRLDADAVIALGGGSAIVTARAATILLAEQGDARTLCTRLDASGKLISPRLLKPKIPQLVIPTTPTTATVRVGSALLDPVAGERLSLYDPATRAQVVLIHPDLIKTAPPDLVVSAGVNTLVLAVEGLMTHSGDPISDALLIHAVRLLVRNLPRVKTGDDLSVRADLILASVMCGQGTDYTGAGAAMAIGHSIRAMYQTNNGIADSIVLPYVLHFNAPSSRTGINKLAAALALTQSDEASTITAVVAAFNALFDELNIPRRLRDLGVTQDTLQKLAEISLTDWFMETNPRKVHDSAELEPILEKAW